MERIGFVGVGLMGEGMAASALKAGHPLTVIAHRARGAVERLTAGGAVEAASLAELAAASEVIALCLSNADVVRDVVEALRPSLSAGQLIIDTSTSDPVVTRALAQALATDGVSMADAPVTGGPPQAAAGALATLLGADEAVRPRAEAIVGTWSKTVRHFGPVGSGHAAKLINNFVTQGTAALLQEAYGRARRIGLSVEALHAVQVNGAARSGTFEKVVTPTLEGHFEASGFSIANATKDLTYYAAFAAAEGSPSPLAEAARDALARFVAAGYGDSHTSRMLDPEAFDKAVSG